MDNQTLLLVLTAFVAVSSIALVVQMGLLFGMYKASKATQEQVTALLPQVKSVLATAEQTLGETRTRLATISERATAITDRATELLDLSKTQLTRLDAVLADASTRAHTQLDRVELVVDDTVSRVHESVALVHSGIVKPLREINGITAGIRAALHAFLQGGRPQVNQVTQDEEMYI